MKPGPRDHRHQLLIAGDELRELKNHTYDLAESFGLDRKIEKYQGTRPITLYRWDLDCLLDVIAVALEDKAEYPDHSSPAYQALKRLGERLRQEYDAVYGHEKGATSQQAEKPAKGRAKSASAQAAGQKTAAQGGPGKPTTKPPTVYQLKITLAGIKPPVWRRVEVTDCTLADLHEVIQVALGWGGFHLWVFDIGGEQYGDDPDSDLEIQSARKLKLSQVVRQGIKKFHYTYDFGDNWDHVIQVEKVLEADPKGKYPQCVKGSRACPPEDCGGVWGYGNLLEAIQNPSHESHHEMLEWVGGDFDPEKFDIEAVNKDLAKVR